MRKFLTVALIAIATASSVTAASAQVRYRSDEAKQQESSQPSIPSGPTDRGYLAE